MQYRNIHQAVFLERPNRFIAHARLGGGQVICHVKNTGRCRELLVPGAEIYLEESDNPARKTRYDLVTVRKGERLINMDSQAPNKLFEEWVRTSARFGPPSLVRGEFPHLSSRFDFYLEAGARRILVEVKGVTLERDGAVFFPDAPTLRGLKHLRELAVSLSQGFEAWAVFLIQMEGARYFSPNDETHPEFGRALEEVRAQGVSLLALDCRVEPDRVAVKSEIPIRLGGDQI